MRKKLLAVIIIGAAATLVVIWSGTSKPRPPSANAGARMSTVVPPPLQVTGAWARPAIKGGTGGAFMTLENPSNNVVRILSASTTAAERAELHETSVTDNVAHMQMRATLDVAPQQKLTLAPGSVHLMLLGLNRALVPGDTIDVMLRVSQVAHPEIGEIVVRVPVPVQSP